MPSVAVLGTRGYPSYYGGFETAVRMLAPELANMGWDVTVYGRRGGSRPQNGYGDPRVTALETRGMDSRNLSTLSYGLSSSWDACVRRPDVALVMNVANGYFLPMLKARDIPTLVNVDGLEWERDKWSPLAKRVFRTGANLTAKYATGLVFDALAIESFWRQEFGAEGTYIPYGGDVLPALPVPAGHQHRQYVLLVARFVPENSVSEFFEAVPRIAEAHPVVIVGSTGYGGALDDAARRLAEVDPQVTWLGHLSNDRQLHALWQHAGVYFHGHSVGGTNPALVQAMAAGAPILARDTVYNREVLGPEGKFVSADPSAIATAVLQMMGTPDDLEHSGAVNVQRAEDRYAWKQVCIDYESALRKLIRKKS